MLYILSVRTQGIINFIKYASKIYFICLPLIGFRIFFILKEKNRKKLFFLIFMRIILLFGITVIFNYLFGLKGVLYSWSLSELITFFIIVNNFL